MPVTDAVKPYRFDTALSCGHVISMVVRAMTYQEERTIICAECGTVNNMTVDVLLWGAEFGTTDGAEHQWRKLEVRILQEATDAFR